MTQIFISYSRRDLDFVERLAKDLEACGLETWYDLSGLEVGTRWGKEIQTAIQQSQYFIVILSPNSIESEWVEKEFLYANSLRVKIIPLLYKHCSLPMWFINLHFIDMQGKNYKLHFPELLKALGIQTIEKGRLREQGNVFQIKETSDRQKLPSTEIEANFEVPAPVEKNIPLEQEPTPIRKTPPQEAPPKKKSRLPKRKVKLRPIWIILLVGLMAVTSFLVWGMPPLAARIAGTLEDSTQAAPAKVTIVIGVTESITSLDPVNIGNILDGELIKNLNEGLLGLKPGTTELEPVLAEDMPEISADGLTYTLILRPGIKFADGLELTAPLYAQQLNRMLTIGSTCLQGYATGLAIPYITSITAPDDVTIVFNLKTQLAFFPHLLASFLYSPSHPDVFPVDECILVPEVPIYGVGPWFISQHTETGLVVLEPNPYYTGPYPAQVEKIILRYFADPDAMVSALKTGEIDISWRALDSEQMAQFEGIPGVTVGSFPGGGIRFLFLNHAMAPMDDQNVVKAIASAIDRDEIIEKVFDGNAIPIHSMVPPGVPGATEAFDTLYSAPNLDQAKQFLKASGYTETNKLTVDLWYPVDHWNCPSWMELIAQQLKATGIITTNLHWSSWSEYTLQLAGENLYPAGAGGWGIDYPDPADFLDPFTFNGGMGNNITAPQEGSTFGVPINSKAQQLVELLSQADVETDQTVRTVLYQQAQEIYADLVVTIPLFMESNYIIYRDTIYGSSEYPHPETLNIGLGNLLNYSLLTKSP